MAWPWDGVPGGGLRAGALAGGELLSSGGLLQADYPACYSAQEVAAHLLSGQHDKATMMLQHSPGGPCSRVWLPSGAPYSQAARPFLPFAKQVLLEHAGGLYAPLVNLVCFVHATDALRYMLKEGPASLLGVTDDMGLRPLHMVLLTDYREGLGLLLKNSTGDILHTKTLNPIILCILMRSSLLDVLLEYAPLKVLNDVYTVYAPGQTYARQTHAPLQLACAEEPVWMHGVTRLLEAGANCNAEDRCGRTPLFSAVEGGREALVQLLVDHHADLDHQDQHGKAALHVAMGLAEPAAAERMVALLLRLGADQISVDLSNQTPLEKAVHLHRHSCIKLLLRQCPPSDLLLLALDLNMEGQFRRINKSFKRFQNFVERGRNPIQAYLLASLNRELTVWLHVLYWSLLAAARHIVPMVAAALRFRASVLELLDPHARALYSHVCELMREYEHSPLSLKELCRFRIRCRLVNVRLETVRALELPASLLDYLNLLDTDLPG